MLSRIVIDFCFSAFPPVLQNTYFYHLRLIFNKCVLLYITIIKFLYYENIFLALSFRSY